MNRVYFVFVRVLRSEPGLLTRSRIEPGLKPFLVRERSEATMNIVGLVKIFVIGSIKKNSESYLSSVFSLYCFVLFCYVSSL